MSFLPLKGKINHNPYSKKKIILDFVMTNYIVWLTCYLAVSYLKINIKYLMASLYFTKILCNGQYTSYRKLKILSPMKSNSQIFISVIILFLNFFLIAWAESSTWRFTFTCTDFHSIFFLFILFTVMMSFYIVMFYDYAYHHIYISLN